MYVFIEPRSLTEWFNTVVILHTNKNVNYEKKETKNKRRIQWNISKDNCEIMERTKMFFKENFNKRWALICKLK